jgi:protein SOK2
MNAHAHAQPYLDMQHHSHLSGGQQPAPQTVTSSGMSHYSQYGQPPLLQPGPGNYSPAQSSYGAYGYTNGVASPQTATHPASGAMVGSQVPAQLLPLPGKFSVPSPGSNRAIIDERQTNMWRLFFFSAMAPAGQPPPGAVSAGQGYPPQSFDATGQIAPAGMKPRVTATLWEDEGSLCFQVEAKGVCVARREGKPLPARLDFGLGCHFGSSRTLTNGLFIHR